MNDDFEECFTKQFELLPEDIQTSVINYKDDPIRLEKLLEK